MNAPPFFRAAPLDIEVSNLVPEGEAWAKPSPRNLVDDLRAGLDRMLTEAPAPSPTYLVSPRTFLHLTAEMTPGLTYAQRRTMHERIRYDERRLKLRPSPGPLPPIADRAAALLAIGRAVR